MQRFLLGIAASAVIGYAGYAKRALSRSGMVAAVVVGTLIFSFGGWDWGVLLVAFFVSSSVLSKFREREKSGLAEKFSKGNKRDWGQAMANGGVGAIIALAFAMFDPALQPFFLASYAGAMATVNADTWATEIGVLSHAKPRLVTTGRIVEVGTSGGVTGKGTIAAATGSAFIGLLAGVFQIIGGSEAIWGLELFFASLVGGLVGCFFDSLLGATVQAVYYCDHCTKETERKIHLCGSVSRQIRGWGWLSNDLVNLTSSIVGALVAAGFVAWV